MLSNASYSPFSLQHTPNAGGTQYNQSYGTSLSVCSPNSFSIASPRYSPTSPTYSSGVGS
ncbi:DNA-directed RNA polymerase II subunit RPB1-like [Acyrthosiphon pisum]|uniref:Uncharacterized protein n=1 Tax=Acyrthosiphon pisum TaxID=7029 RepID=A0A8R2JNH2_ACYPI|nr:DNA-directed RNA polymerase II subunit RPB1-like [Acyrthosiphon pisum]